MTRTEEPPPPLVVGTDADKLIQYTAALARHIEHGSQLLEAANMALARTQNASTSDIRPDPKVWKECQALLTNIEVAIYGCKNRSETLR